MNMSFEETLQSSFEAVREYPEILLPVVLNWIPITLFYFVMYDVMSEFKDMFSFVRSISMSANFPPLMTIFWAVFPYLLILLGIGFLYILIDIFLISIYTRVTVGFYDGNINLVEIFSESKRDIKSLLWTYLLVFLILTGISSGLIILGILFFPLGLIITSLGMIPLIIFSIIFLFEVPPSIIIEGKSGLSALKRSKELAEGNKIVILVLVLVVTFASGLINSFVNSIPFIGHQISLLSMTFFTTWQLMLPTAFYKKFIVS